MEEVDVTDASNARQLTTEIKERLEAIEHEIGQIGGLLEDLAVYLPKP